MRRSTKLVLWLGCALVLALEGPLAVTLLATSLGGPYGKAGRTPVSLAERPAKRSSGGLELARR